MAEYLLEPMPITIPFSGFYESFHSSEIDFIEEGILDGDPNYKMGDVLDVDYKKLHAWYASVYLEAFVEELQALHPALSNVNIEFKELVSPREYNFTTDVIYGEISKKDFTLLMMVVDVDDLQREISNRFTSCDGFVSFYSNKLEEWDSDFSEWDHNQAGTVLESLYADTFEAVVDGELIQEALIENMSDVRLKDGREATDDKDSK